MGDKVKAQIVKLFLVANESLGCAIEVYTNIYKRKKIKYLVFTVSKQAPSIIQLYIVKLLDKMECKKKIICNTSRLLSFDCHDTPSQPTFDIEITTDLKVWSLHAVKLNEKHLFVSSFCRAVATYQPTLYRKMELLNLPHEVLSSLKSSDGLDFSIDESAPDELDSNDDHAEGGLDDTDGSDGQAAQYGNETNLMGIRLRRAADIDALDSKAVNSDLSSLVAASSLSTVSGQPNSMADQQQLQLVPSSAKVTTSGTDILSTSPVTRSIPGSDMPLLRQQRRGTCLFQPLGPKEEIDMRRFLDESGSELVMNAPAFMERLNQLLADVEGTNIHSIMASESQVINLMLTLDKAISQLDLIEKKMDTYNSYLADVEESMSMLRDRDQIVQLTADNRSRLLDVLEHVASKTQLDKAIVRTLTTADLISAGGVDRCAAAAHQLDAIMGIKPLEGEMYLRAAQIGFEEAERVRDTFARKLASQVNDSVLRFAAQLTVVHTTGTGSSSAGSASDFSSLSKSGSNGLVVYPAWLSLYADLYTAQRRDLLQLAPLIGGWLQTNRIDIYIGLKKMYVEKLRPFLSRQVREYLLAAQQTIFNLLKSQKAHQSKGLDPTTPSDLHYLLSYTASPTLILHSEKIFEDSLKKVIQVVHSEESFLLDFFYLLRSGELSRQSSDDPKLSDPFASSVLCLEHLFFGIDRDVKELILTACEQVQPALSMPLLVVLVRAAETMHSLQVSPTPSASTSSLGGTTPASNISSTGTTAGSGFRVPGFSGIGFGRSGSLTFLSQLLSFLMLEAKRSFTRLIEQMIQSFTENKPSKRSRGGLLPMVRIYERFSQLANSAFADSGRISDLERAHGELVRSLMTEIERVASESVKTPREVVQMENYHRLHDILYRLKLPGLEENRRVVKQRYQLALRDYTTTSMGRPLEKLHTFFEQVQMAMDAGVKAEAVSYQFAFSKQEVKKVIREYPGKEVKRGLENLCKKVEKNLSEEGNLFPVVWGSIQTEFIHQCSIYGDLINRCYPLSGIALEFTIADLQIYFTEIARAR